jgi:hypothetical protein
MEYEVIYYVAIVTLVSGEEVGNVPETMLLDTERLVVLNTQFHSHVVSAIILTACSRAIYLEPGWGTLGWTGKVMETVQQLVMEYPPHPTTPQKTVGLVMEELVRQVPAEYVVRVQTALQPLLDVNLQTTSMVYQAMVKSYKRVWYHVIRSLPAERNIPQCAMLLLPGLMENATNLTALALLSINVHTQRYNDIISDVVKAHMASKGLVSQPA